MQEKTLILNECLFIARGRQREFYIHPENPDLSIKGTVRTFSNWRKKNQREVKYYKSLNQKGIDLTRVAAYNGLVGTDKERGLLLNLIKTKDGSVCENLQYHIEMQSISRKEIQFELACLKSWLLENAIIVSDLKPANIAYNPDNAPGHRLIPVNGCDNRDLIKIANIVKPLARCRIKRAWKIFNEKHLKPKKGPSEFKWFFNPNVRCNSEFFAFLNLHVDTRLRGGLSSRHQLEYHDYKNKSYVFKRFSPSDNSEFSRKIELSLKSYIVSGAQRSFRGAFWLQEAGISSITPVAWAVIRKGYSQVSYFVYEKIESTGSIQDAIECEDVPVDTRSNLIIKMGKITRKIHKEGLRHTDIVAHNFLYKKKSGDFDIYVIDTDKMQKCRLSILPEIKLFYDLRCLRRLKLNKDLTKIFFDSYFDEQCKSYHLKMWKFWLAGGFSLPRRFKKRKDKKIKELMEMIF